MAAFKHRFALLEQPREPLPYEVEIHAQELRGVTLYESSPSRLQLFSHA
jgi:hypothetical protein